MKWNAKTLIDSHIPYWLPDSQKSNVSFKSSESTYVTYVTNYIIFGHVKTTFENLLKLNINLLINVILKNQLVILVAVILAK